MKDGFEDKNLVIMKADQLSKQSLFNAVKFFETDCQICFNNYQDNLNNLVVYCSW